MSDSNLLKLVEVAGILLAGGLFVWWQWRDVNRAQEDTRRRRESAVQDEKPMKEPIGQGGQSGPHISEGPHRP